MIAIAFQQSSIVNQLSLNLTPKKRLSNLSIPDKRPLIPGFYLVLFNNDKKTIAPNDSLYL